MTEHEARTEDKTMHGDAAYRNPGVLRAMATKREWPCRVVYADGVAYVECGQWGRQGGWIGFTLVFAAHELPESRVAALYIKEPQA